MACLKIKPAYCPDVCLAGAPCPVNDLGRQVAGGAADRVPRVEVCLPVTQAKVGHHNLALLRVVVIQEVFKLKC